MKVLLVYELIPEETKFFVFENLNPNSELYKNLLLAHGHYANFNGDTGDNTGTEFLTQYLDPKTAVDVKSIPTSGPFDVVFHSGFGM